jgi:hypothetical protein
LSQLIPVEQNHNHEVVPEKTSNDGSYEANLVVILDERREKRLSNSEVSESDCLSFVVPKFVASILFTIFEGNWT